MAHDHEFKLDLDGQVTCITCGAMDDDMATFSVIKKIEKCHYCQALAKYNDLAEVDRTYKIVGVCACHSYKGLSS